MPVSVAMDFLVPLFVIIEQSLERIHKIQGTLGICFHPSPDRDLRAKLKTGSNPYVQRTA
jgi:hypothetical protein